MDAKEIQQNLSLVITTGNAEQTIESTMDSVAGWIAELVIVDNGITDHTMQIAREWCEDNGVTLKHVLHTATTHPTHFIADTEDEHGIPEHDGFQNTGNVMLADFAAARNLAIESATKPVVLMLDSDDVYHHPENLPAIFAIIEQGADIVYFPYEIMDPASGRISEVIKNPRLFIREKYPSHLKYVGRCHEGIEARDCNVFILTQSKFGFIRDMRDNPNRNAVAWRNLKILSYANENGDSSARTLYYLARELFNTGVPSFHRTAMPLLTRYLKHPEAGAKEERAQACILKSNIHEEQGELENAFAEAKFALAEHENPDTLLTMARVQFKLAVSYKDDEKAKNRYEDCIERTIAAHTLLKGGKQTILGHSEKLVRGSFILLADAHWRLRDYRACAQACIQGLTVAPGNRFLLDTQMAALEHIDPATRTQLQNEALEAMTRASNARKSSSDQRTE